MSKNRKDLTPAEEEDFLIKLILAKVKKDIRRDQSSLIKRAGFDRNAENELDEIINILGTDKNGESLTQALKNNDRTRISELYKDLKQEVIEAEKDLEGGLRKTALAIPRFITGVSGVVFMALGESIHFAGAALRVATKVITLGKYGNLHGYQDVSIDENGKVKISQDRGENIVSKLGMTISNLGSSAIVSAVEPLVDSKNAEVKKIEGARSFQKQMEDRSLVRNKDNRGK